MKDENKATEAANKFISMITGYTKDCATRSVLRYYVSTLEDMVEQVDNEIEEMDRAQADDEANALAIVRNRLNSVRIEIAILANEAERKVLEFEKARDLAE